MTEHTKAKSAERSFSSKIEMMLRAAPLYDFYQNLIQQTLSPEWLKQILEQ
jgi:hypothetical protein